jgi:hydrogenase maturation protein HypF
LREPVGPTLAVGGELKNTFCLAEGTHAWMSQHLGDMQNLETLRAFERSVQQFTGMYGIAPERIAADAHPDHLTRRWAEDATDSLRPVQHHHAHVGALMAEAGLPGDEPVIGVAFDGTGLGLDGAIWGGEVLLADHTTAERFAHLDEIPLPGGDAAIRKPYRTALAHLWAAGRHWSDDLPPVAHCGDDERRALASMLESGTGCVPTTSMGRLFDAVSSILGLRHEITYEGQAAMELEHLATGAEVDGGPLRFSVDGPRIGVAGLIGELVGRRSRGESVPSLAAAFHLGVADLVGEVARSAREVHGISTVGLTGGVFQNALLVTITRRLLEADGFGVLTHQLVPPNDGGLALGQLVIAARHV